MEVSGQIHAPAALPRGKTPRYPFDRRLGGPQSRSIEEKNSYPRRESSPDHPIVQPVVSRIIVTQVVKKLPANDETRRFITVFTRDRRWPLS